jgi:hypothetical protein
MTELRDNDTVRELTPSEMEQVGGGIFNGVAGNGAVANGAGIVQGTQLAGAALAIVQTQAFAGVSGVA